jgi:hypothetical protein
MKILDPQHNPQLGAYKSAPTCQEFPDPAVKNGKILHGQ